MTGAYIAVKTCVVFIPGINRRFVGVVKMLVGKDVLKVWITSVACSKNALNSYSKRRQITVINDNNILGEIILHETVFTEI